MYSCGVQEPVNQVSKKFTGRGMSIAEVLCGKNPTNTIIQTKRGNAGGKEFSCDFKESFHRLHTNYNSKNVPLHEEVS